MHDKKGALERLTQQHGAAIMCTYSNLMTGSTGYVMADMVTQWHEQHGDMISWTIVDFGTHWCVDMLKQLQLVPCCNDWHNAWWDGEMVKCYHGGAMAWWHHASLILAFEPIYGDLLPEKPCHNVTLWACHHMPIWSIHHVNMCTCWCITMEPSDHATMWPWHHITIWSCQHMDLWLYCHAYTVSIRD